MIFFELVLFLWSTLAITSVSAYTGDATWFYIANPSGGAPTPGACGQIHNDNEYVCAVAHGTFDTYPGAGADPNTNPICGQNLKATYDGKSVVVKVVDRCADCDIPTSIDLSPVAFSQLADQSVGRLYNVLWEWTTEAPGPVAGGVGVDASLDVTARDSPSPLSGSVLVPGRIGARTPQMIRLHERSTKETSASLDVAAREAEAPSVSGDKRRKSIGDVGNERGRMVRRHRRAVSYQLS